MESIPTDIITYSKLINNPEKDFNLDWIVPEEDFKSISNIFFNEIFCVINDTNQIMYLSDNIDIIGIDEAQFFDDSIIDVSNNLAKEGKRIIVAGLDRDYRAIPFGPMANLLTHADYITKLNAICMVCGNEASFSQRLTKDKTQILVGESEKYEARCRNCYES